MHTGKIFALLACFVWSVAAQAQTAGQITLTANHIVSDPVSGRIYASVPSTAPQYGNSIVAIDPARAKIVGSAFVGSDPTRLALSDDGQFLYVGLDGADAVRRVALKTLTPGLQFGLGSDSFLGPYHAGDIAVMPGHPHTIAVSRNFSGVSPANNGLAIFDDGVVRPNTVGRAQGLFDSIAFANSPSLLYAQNGEDSGFNFYTLNVDARGVSLQDDQGNLITGFDSRIVFDPHTGLVYGPQLAVDPVAETHQGIFNFEPYLLGGALWANSILPDTEHGRVFLLMSNGFTAPADVILAAYDARTYLPLGSLTLLGAGPGTDLVKWGKNGLAFSNGKQIVLLPDRDVPGLASMQLSATKVIGGGALNGVVTLMRPAPPGGVTLALFLSNSSVVFPSGPISIPAGAISQTFTLTTAAVGNSLDVSLTMSYGIQNLTSTFTVLNSASTPVYPRNMHVLYLATNDMIYEPVSQRLYASVPDSAGPIGNSIARINPLTAQIEDTHFIGSVPYRLAASTNGQYLYAGLFGSASVRRFNLATQTPEIQFWLGADSFLGTNYPGELVVLPRSPHAVAVSRSHTGVSPFFAGVAVYDDGVARPKEDNNFTGGEVIAPGANDTRLYGYDNETTGFEFVRMKLDRSGITILDSTSNLLTGFDVDIKYAAGKIYSTNGLVIDPEAKALLGRFALAGTTQAMLPDPATHHVYFVAVDSSNNYTLQIFDADTYLPLAAYLLPGISDYPQSLVRITSDQLAFRTTGGQIVFVNVTPAQLAALQLGSTSVRGGAHVAGRVALSNVAPVGGLEVTLTSSDPSIAAVPSGVAVPAGASIGAFTVITGKVTAAKTVTITAKYGSITKRLPLDIH